MTDPRQTSRDSATSARTKTFVDAPMHVVVDPPRRRWITGHGLGWLIGVIVGLATLWAVFHGGHL